MFNRKCVIGISLCIALGISPVNVYAGEQREIPVEETGELGKVLEKETEEELFELQNELEDMVKEEIASENGEEAPVLDVVEIEEEAIGEEIAENSQETWSETEELPMQAEGDIEINEENFPDENFRKFLLENGFADKGQTMSAAKREGIIMINCAGSAGSFISDLTGIEYFPNLERLDCSFNTLESLDVSKNVNLVILDCSNNYMINSLDFSNNPYLRELYCYGNNPFGQLSNLNVSKNDRLEVLDCANQMDLENLDLSGNPALKILDCNTTGRTGSAKLSSLDLSRNQELEELTCAGLDLGSLDLSGNPALKTVDCSSCNLVSLNLNGDSALKDLSCQNNNLSSLELSGNPALKNLICFNNNLVSLDLSHNPVLGWLNCSNNKLSDLDVSSNVDMYFLSCDENQLKALNVSGCSALMSLYCSENQLKSLDVSNCPALEKLDCYSNQLSSLDINACQKLTDSNFAANNNVVYAGGNQINMVQRDSKFDAGKVSNLQNLDFDGSIFRIAGDEKGTYDYDCGHSLTMTVTIEAKENPNPETPDGIFSDVPTRPGYWKYDNIKYISERGIMGGVGGSDQFQPDEPLTRAMFATVLYRMAGEPDVEYTDKFTDVPDGQWYSDAILWANQNGIVSGYSDGSGRYGINDNITREQIAKMLHIYGEVMGYDVSGKASIEHFTDKESVSAWAVEHIQWSVDAEMISGKPNDAEGSSYRIDPKGEATRAECAKMLTMFMKKYD